MRIILLRAIGTLFGGLIRCTLRLGETYIKHVEALVEVLLPQVLLLVLVLEEEVTLRKDLLLAVEDL